MNMFTIDADNLIGANVFGVRKDDLLTGRYSNPSVVTYTDWAPYPGFTIMLSITQVGGRLRPRSSCGCTSSVRQSVTAAPP